MEVANASMYDGASALAEAVLMAVRMNDGERVLLLKSLHPFYRQVVATYTRGIGLELVDIPWADSGAVDSGGFEARVDGSHRGGGRAKSQFFRRARTLRRNRRVARRSANGFLWRASIPCPSARFARRGILARISSWAMGNPWACPCLTAGPMSDFLRRGRPTSAKCPGGSAARRPMWMANAGSC